MVSQVVNERSFVNQLGVVTIARFPQYQSPSTSVNLATAKVTAGVTIMTRWTVTLGTIAGTAVRIHLTFILFLLLIGFLVYRANGSSAAWDTMAFVALIFLCVVLHEFGHILTARHFGIKTPSVTLYPIGGVASMERLPEKPSQELLVAIAGPAVNFAIFLLLVIIIGTGFSVTDVENLDQAGANLAMRIAAANLILMLFNLLPAFPMDGGRVLRALLAMKLGKARATKIAAGIGQVFAIGLGFMGFFGNPMLIFIALFIFIAAGAEADVVALHDATHDLLVGDAMIFAPTAMHPSDRIEATIDRLLRSSDDDFPIVDDNGNASGIVSRGDILQALANNIETQPISAIMRPADHGLKESDTLEKALTIFESSDLPALIVVDQDQRSAGLITRSSIAQLMLVRTARPDWALHRGGMLAQSLPGLKRRP
jgi:Zn-dependent protease/predicted transcriptional regulator